MHAYRVCALGGRWLGITTGSYEDVGGVESCGTSDDDATKPDAEFEFCISLEKKQVVVKGLYEEPKEKSCCL